MERPLGPKRTMTTTAHTSTISLINWGYVLPAYLRDSTHGCEDGGRLTTSMQCFSMLRSGLKLCVWVGVHACVCVCVGGCTCMLVYVYICVQLLVIKQVYSTSHCICCTDHVSRVLSMRCDTSITAERPSERSREFPTSPPSSLYVNSVQ